MNVGELRAALEGLPDDMEVIGEFGNSGQKNVVYAEVCTHEHKGLSYHRECMEESLRGENGPTMADPELWDELEKQTFKIVM